MKTLFKVPDADNDNDDVDSSKVSDDWDEVNDQLLRQLQVLHIDGIQARLGAATNGEEEGIDGRQVSKATQYEESNQRAADDVNICCKC